MATPAELQSLVKKLTAATNDAERVGILQALKTEAVITESLLRESKAGLAVGKLRTHANADVQGLAKELVKKWRGEVDKEKAARGAGGSKPARKASMTPAPQTPVTPTGVRAPAPAAASNAPARTAKTDGMKFNALGDKTRDKCAELMYDALALDSDQPAELIQTRAQAVEAAVWAAHGRNAGAEYKTRIRTLMVNLKDRANPGLRAGVVAGDPDAAALATMSTEDMASAERKAENAKIQEQNLFNTLAAAEQEAETDAFTCGRCKQSKCRYRQAQTRSADEPMTTFVTCTNCGHRWKFS